MTDRRTIGYLLAASALLITIPRYIEVFSRIDRWALTAYGMGILLALGAVYILDAWADARNRGIVSKPLWLLLAAFGINLAYEPLIVVPYVLAQLWQLDMAAVMSGWYAVLWAIIVASAPVVLAGGVVLAISYRKEPRERRQRAESAEEVVEEPEEIGYRCEHCEFVGSSQQALNAHRRFCNNGKTEPLSEMRV